MSAASKLAVPACLLLGLAIFAYSVTRALLMSFNNDESLTYLYFVQLSVADIVSSNGKILATNNHPLNSLLMKLASSVFGSSEFALRLPNILAHVVYLISSFLIVRKYVPNYLAPVCFLLFSMNPYLLEFFSLARGYGLALGFMMCSIYFCLRYLESQGRGPLNVFFSSMFAGLAVYSSFSFLNYYVALSAIIVVIALSRTRGSGNGFDNYRRRLIPALRDIFPLALNSLILVAVSLPSLMKVRQTLLKSSQIEEFGVGGRRGFWEDSVLSLISSSLYRQDYRHTVVPVLAIFVVSVLAFGGVLFLYSVWRQRSERRLALTLVVVPLTLLIATSSILQHHLFGVSYLKDRIAIMFVPLFVLSLVGTSTYLVTAREPVVRKVGVLLVLVVALGASVHTLLASNLSHSMILRGNASTKQMIIDVTADYEASRQRGDDDQVRLGIAPIYKPVVDYYIVSRKLTWLEAVELRHLGDEFDYVYYKPENARAVGAQKTIELAVYPIRYDMLTPVTYDVLAKKAPS
jgi:uncharacterized membrane protein